MKHSKPVWISLLITFLLALLVGPVSSEVFNRLVAVVNDEVITLHELNLKIKELTGLKPEDMKFQNEEMYLQTRRDVLELLIDNRIAKKKIQEMGIRVREKEIDTTIEKIKRDNQWTHEDLLAKLKEKGISHETYRDDIRRDLERFRLINFEVKSKIIIREEQIKEYYEKHEEEFSSDGTVDLASIFLIYKSPGNKSEKGEVRKKGEAILAKIREGGDFKALATKYSEGPGADEGGGLGLFKMSQLEPDLRKLLGAMPEGAVTDLIVRSNGIQIIKLINKVKSKVKPLEEVRDAIYGRLFQREVNKSYESWIKELRKSSYTKIIL